MHHKKPFIFLNDDSYSCDQSSMAIYVGISTNKNKIMNHNMLKKSKDFLSSFSSLNNEKYEQIPNYVHCTILNNRYVSKENDVQKDNITINTTQLNLQLKFSPIFSPRIDHTILSPIRKFDIDKSIKTSTNDTIMKTLNLHDSFSMNNQHVYLWCIQNHPYQPYAISSIIPYKDDKNNKQQQLVKTTTTTTNNNNKSNKRMKKLKYLFNKARQQIQYNNEIERNKMINDLIPSNLFQTRSKRFQISYQQILQKNTLSYYHANYLDDNTIHGTVHSIHYILPGGMNESIINYVKKKQLKNELNKQFSLKHPWLNQSLSLSKIRKVKNDMLRIYKQLHSIIELSTIVLAYYYFEKICCLDKIVKKNRKLIAATCLLLAAKYNESTLFQIQDIFLQKKFFKSIKEIFFIKKQIILKNEFHTFVLLDFNLNANLHDLNIHLNHFKNLINFQ